MKFDFGSWAFRWKENTDRETINYNAGQHYDVVIARDCNTVRLMLFAEVFKFMAQMPACEDADVAAEQLFHLVNATRLALGMPLLDAGEELDTVDAAPSACDLLAANLPQFVGPLPTTGPN